MSDLDDYLTYRAEQAVLGALLAGADPAAVGPLRAAAFADPVHQAIYAALTRPNGSRAGRLRDRVARITSQDVHDAVAYAAALPGRCRDPAHLAAYAGMLREARPGHHAAGQPGQSPGRSPERLPTQDSSSRGRAGGCRRPPPRGMPGAVPGPQASGQRRTGAASA